MHGTGVFLPHKVRFFVEAASETHADIIAFAYRGFGVSDHVAPTENGLRQDIQAITRYFE